jgi:hypothetical protein
MRIAVNRRGQVRARPLDRVRARRLDHPPALRRVVLAQVRAQSNGRVRRVRDPHGRFEISEHGGWRASGCVNLQPNGHVAVARNAVHARAHAERRRARERG